MNRTKHCGCAGLAASLVLLGPIAGEKRSEGADGLRPQLVAQVGHTGAIRRIAFAPDGRTVLMASAFGDPTPRLWEVATGRLIRPFVGHDGAILDIAFSPDGRHVLSGGVDKSARLWDAATGREVHRFTGHTYHVSSVAFFPDGRTAVTGSLDRTVRLWDVETGREKSPRFEGKEGVGTVCVSPDGTKIIIGGNVNGGGLLWDPFEGRTIRRIGTENGSDFEVATFAPDGRTILSWGRLSAPRLWDATTGRLLRTLPASASASTDSAAFSPDGKSILTASDGILRDAATGDEIRKYDFGAEGACSVAFSPDGRSFLTGSDRPQEGKAWLAARLWETATGKALVRFAGRIAPLDSVAPIAKPPAIQVQAKVKYDVVGRERIGMGSVKTTQDLITWDLERGREARRLTAEPKTPEILGMTGWPDGTRYLFRRGDDTQPPKDPKTGRSVPVARMAFLPNLVVVSPDGSQVMTNGGFSGILWDLKTGREIRGFKADTKGAMAYAFSPDGRWVLEGDNDATARIWEIESGRELRRLEGHTDRVLAVAASADSRQILTGSLDKTARLWDAATGRELWRAEGHQNAVKSVAFFPDGQAVLTASDDGTTGVWDLGTGRELCRMISFPDDTWAVLAPDGRFDTNRPEALPDLHWIFPDDPFRPLASEIFLRDNFEPKLLPRILAREPARPVRPLAEVNRVQPVVKILRIEPADRPDVVSVTVEVAEAEGKYVRGGREATMKTGPYDLRLFRDGHLVGQWPDSAEDGPEPNASTPSGLQLWRQATRIPVEDSGRSTRTFRVTLPRRPDAKLEFTAYAFNEDRVKSETAGASHVAPAFPSTDRPRAYLVCMGVGASQSRRWDLQFAAADARLIADALGQALARAGRYDIVPVLLTSERAEDGSLASAAATKANLKAALRFLAGNKVEAETRKQLPGGDKLRRVTPDDLVIVSFSGHGYTDSRGELYLLPHDVGEDKRTVDEILPNCISTAELSSWLRGMDEGAAAMIVDACHSAATVQQPDFKPGPFGVRGLGQLAYDKGMRVLAASQANDVAVESVKIRQGLLTYALVRNGLEQGRSAKEGIVTLGGLLGYAAERVPSLYREVLAGEVKDADGTAARNVGAVRPKLGQASAIQRPEFFDFGRSQSDITIDRKFGGG